VVESLAAANLTPEPHGHGSFLPILFRVYGGWCPLALALGSACCLKCRYAPTRPIAIDSINFFPLLCTNWLGAHGRIFVVLVVQRQHGNHASAVGIIGHQLGPASVAQSSPSDEAASPVVTEPHSILIFDYDWKMYFAPSERTSDVIPLAHQEPQDFVCLFQILKLVGFRCLAPEHLRQIFAWYHGFRTGN